jgi:hypothetical protein
MVNASSAERGHIARVSGGGIYSAVLKGIVKIALVMLKRNIDEGLLTRVYAVSSCVRGSRKSNFGRFPRLGAILAHVLLGNPRPTLTRNRWAPLVPHGKYAK